MNELNKITWKMYFLSSDTFVFFCSDQSESRIPHHFGPTEVNGLLVKSAIFFFFVVRGQCDWRSFNTNLLSGLPERFYSIRSMTIQRRLVYLGENAKARVLTYR